MAGQKYILRLLQGLKGLFFRIVSFWSVVPRVKSFPANRVSLRKCSQVFLRLFCPGLIKLSVCIVPMTSYRGNKWWYNLFSPHVDIFPKGENYKIHQRVKAFLFKIPLKWDLFFIQEKRRENFHKSSIIGTPNRTGAR